MINPSFDGWSIKSDLILPENAFKMVALYPRILSIKGGSLPGFITIYEIQSKLYGKSCVVDPMEKVNVILEKIHNGSDLTTVVLPTGRRLLENTKLSTEDINQAAKAIEALQKARKSVVTVSGGAGQYSSHAPQLGSSVSCHSEKISEGGNAITDIALVSSLRNICICSWLTPKVGRMALARVLDDRDCGVVN